MAQVLMAKGSRESLSAASNVSFIYLANICSALPPVTLLDSGKSVMIKESCFLSVHRVYCLEVDSINEMNGINEILSEITALKERNTVLVGESALTMELI